MLTQVGFQGVGLGQPDGGGMVRIVETLEVLDGSAAGQDLHRPLVSHEHGGREASAHVEVGPSILAGGDDHLLLGSESHAGAEHRDDQRRKRTLEAHGHSLPLSTA